MIVQYSFVDLNRMICKILLPLLLQILIEGYTFCIVIFLLKVFFYIARENQHVMFYSNLFTLKNENSYFIFVILSPSSSPLWLIGQTKDSQAEITHHFPSKGSSCYWQCTDCKQMTSCFQSLVLVERIEQKCPLVKHFLNKNDLLIYLQILNDATIDN